MTTPISWICDDEEDSTEDQRVEETSLVEIEEQIRQYAKDAVLRFFKDKRMHCGGSIPEGVLTSPNSLAMLDIEVFDGIKRMHELLDQNESLIPCKDDERIGNTSSHITPAMALILEVFGMCRCADIPKEYSAGIALLYFKHCLGMEENAGEEFNNSAFE